MKKRNILVAALIMGALVVGSVNCQAEETKTELTKDNALELIMKAGETDNIVKNHGSYEVNCEYKLQDETVHDYEDSELAYMNVYGVQYLYEESGAIIYGKDDEEGNYISPVYIDESEGEDEFLTSLYEDVTIDEEITDIKEDGDTITIQTEPSKDMTESILRDQGDGDYYKDGDWISMEYTVAADDYRMIRSVQILNHEDGTSEETSVMEVSYGGDRPEEVTDLYEKYQEAESTEDTRTVTVTVSPDTDEEKDYSVTLPKENAAWILLHSSDNYYILYTDRECKELYEGEKTEEDVHVYAEIEAYEAEEA